MKPMLDPERDLKGATPERWPAPCSGVSSHYDRAQDESPLSATRSR